MSRRHGKTEHALRGVVNKECVRAGGDFQGWADLIGDCMPPLDDPKAIPKLRLALEALAKMPTRPKSGAGNLKAGR